MNELFSQEILILYVMISNYVLCFCMILFLFDCIYALVNSNNSQSLFTYIRQCFWVFVIQLIAFFNLAYNSKEWEYITLYIAIQLFLLIVFCLTPIIYRKMNYTLLVIMCMFLGIGLIMVSRLSIDKAIRQFEIICISYVICIFIPLLISKVQILARLTWFYSVIGAMLLGIVFFTGESTYGSKLSLTISGFTFQPSELVKILFVLFIAGALAESTSILRLLITSAIAGIHVILLVLSTDLGSALIFFITYLTMLFVASRKYWYLLVGILGGCIASILAFYLFSHIQTRVLAWTDPWSYIDNKGYQITQSLFAIGTGSWFGMGLYKGVPDDIPFVEVDFIFSAICEEIGAIFGILLVLTIVVCFMLMMKIALNCNNCFYRLTAFGLSVLYIFQVFLTVGGGIKFIPLTGVTLPLISYGGSSVVSVMILFFVLMGIHSYNQKNLIVNDEENEEENNVENTEEDKTVNDDNDIIDLDLSQKIEIKQAEEGFDEEIEEKQAQTE